MRRSKPIYYEAPLHAPRRPPSPTTMSLRHILNDDPPPHSPGLAPQPPTTNGGSSHTLPDPARPLAPLSPALQPQRERRSRSAVQDVEQPPATREYVYQQQPAGYHSPAGWEHRNGDSMRGDDTPSGPSSTYYAEQDDSATPSPRPSNGTPVGMRQKEGSVEGNGRKKRKLPDDDEDYQPPGQKRVSSSYTCVLLVSSYGVVYTAVATARTSDASTTSQSDSGVGNCRRYPGRGTARVGRGRHQTILGLGRLSRAMVG